MTPIRWSLLHQGVGRGSVFLFFALLPRVMPMAEVGRFAVAYAIAMVCVGPLFDTALGMSVVRWAARGDGVPARRVLRAAPAILWVITGIAFAIAPAGSIYRWLAVHFALALPLSLLFAFARGHGDLRVEGVAGSLSKVALVPALLVAIATGGGDAPAAARAMACSAAVGWLGVIPFAPLLRRRWRELAVRTPSPGDGGTRPVGPVVLLVVVATTGLLMLRVPILLLSRLEGASAAGVFATAQRWVEAGYAVPQAIMLALFPSLAAARSRGGGLRRLGTSFLGLGAALSLALALVARFVIPRVYGPRGLEIAPALLVLALSVPAVCIGTLATQSLAAADRTDAWLGASLAGLGVVVGGSVLLGPGGPLGVAAACVAAEVTVATVSVALLRRALRRGP